MFLNDFSVVVVVVVVCLLLFGGFVVVFLVCVFLGERGVNASPQVSPFPSREELRAIRDVGLRCDWLQQRVTPHDLKHALSFTRVLPWQRSTRGVTLSSRTEPLDENIHLDCRKALVWLAAVSCRYNSYVCGGRFSGWRPEVMDDTIFGTLVPHNCRRSKWQRTCTSRAGRLATTAFIVNTCIAPGGGGLACCCGSERLGQAFHRYYAPPHPPTPNHLPAHPPLPPPLTRL